ncbi:MAG TPA: amino acid permease [Niabella sp.]|nr:amino acid permease [Niabella sp.]HOZ97602.1 amino acid permease [Niabella sp.]HQW15740.1 amino acid permease [Niabella sp.]HQX21015.1 amino acid permease [Niabella sp.]HQX41888.1 amino acid permease [Niabella sp.]
MSLLRKKTIDSILKDAESGYGDGHGVGLNKVLGVRDLTALGIAAVIGAGIFSSIGKAASDGGPGVIFLYIFTAIACGFAALCYAQFASTVPVSGSAYTYSYVAFGEIFAWIIGWDLLMEYAIGNIAVAISWSDYFTGLLHAAGMHIPDWLTMDYLTARHGFEEANGLISSGTALSALDSNIAERFAAWTTAPQLGGLRIIMDLPALLIVILITYIVYVGVKESRNSANLMVLLKLGVIFLVIVVGSFYINQDNWSPFTPTGISGILKGVSAVFFAYIGFDAISTTAEECKNPQQDLPKGMIYSLIICTVIYILVALVLTGMVPYSQLNVGDPLSMVFEARGLKVISIVVAVSAIIATASVLLVFQMGQPRIWMSMSRDGLLPKAFSRVHPKYKTPSFSTIVTGLVVAVPALFLNLETVLALTSIGTLFAFVLVCGGILVLDQQPNKPDSKFKVPYVNGKYIIPLLFIVSIVIILFQAPDHFSSLISLEGFPMVIFWMAMLVISILAFLKKFSLLPVLGMVSCFYLMAQESHTNWLRFLVWLAIGLIIYFAYSRFHSKLARSKA